MSEKYEPLTNYEFDTFVERVELGSPWIPGETYFLTLKRLLATISARDAELKELREATKEWLSMLGEAAKNGVSFNVSPPEDDDEPPAVQHAPADPQGIKAGEAVYQCQPPFRVTESQLEMMAKAAFEVPNEGGEVAHWKEYSGDSHSRWISLLRAAVLAIGGKVVPDGLKSSGVIGGKATTTPTAATPTAEPFLVDASALIQSGIPDALEIAHECGSLALRYLDKFMDSQTAGYQAHILPIIARALEAAQKKAYKSGVEDGNAEGYAKGVFANVPEDSPKEAFTQRPGENGLRANPNYLYKLAGVCVSVTDNQVMISPADTSAPVEITEGELRGMWNDACDKSRNTLGDNPWPHTAAAINAHFRAAPGSAKLAEYKAAMENVAIDAQSHPDAEKLAEEMWKAWYGSGPAAKVYHDRIDSIIARALEAARDVGRTEWKNSYDKIQKNLKYWCERAESAEAALADAQKKAYKSGVEDGNAEGYAKGVFANAPVEITGEEMCNLERKVWVGGTPWINVSDAQKHKFVEFADAINAHFRAAPGSAKRVADEDAKRLGELNRNQQTTIRHQREEIGKLHARLAKLEKLQSRLAELEETVSARELELANRARRIQAAANSAPELCRTVRELESMSRFLLDSCHVAEPFRSKCESMLARVAKMVEVKP